jgi:hypothetical protein
MLQESFDLTQHFLPQQVQYCSWAIASRAACHVLVGKPSHRAGLFNWRTRETGRGAWPFTRSVGVTSCRGTEEANRARKALLQILRTAYTKLH